MQPARHTPFKFDFNEWANLAKSDTAAFEQRRNELLEQFIAQAPEHLRERLRRLQWRIDAERSRCKNPLQSCVTVYQMMWDSVYGNHGLLTALRALQTLQSQDLQDKPRTSARILPIRR